MATRPTATRPSRSVPTIPPRSRTPGRCVPIRAAAQRLPLQVPPASRQNPGQQGLAEDRERQQAREENEQPRQGDERPNGVRRHAEPRPRAGPGPLPRSTQFPTSQADNATSNAGAPIDVIGSAGVSMEASGPPPEIAGNREGISPSQPSAASKDVGSHDQSRATTPGVAGWATSQNARATTAAS